MVLGGSSHRQACPLWTQARVLPPSVPPDDLKQPHQVASLECWRTAKNRQSTHTRDIKVCAWTMVTCIDQRKRNSVLRSWDAFLTRTYTELKILRPKKCWTQSLSLGGAVTSYTLRIKLLVCKNKLFVCLIYSPMYKRHRSSFSLHQKW